MGHTSIANSIISECNDRNIETKVVDMLELAAKFVFNQASAYGAMVEHNPKRYERLYHFAEYHHELQGWFFTWGLIKKFRKILDEYQPDIVVSVHPNYVYNIMRIKKRYKYNFKFVVVIADPVTPNSCFVHPEADLNIIPTQDAIDFLSQEIKVDLSTYKMAVNILPVRREIVEASKHITLQDIENYQISDPFKVVIISGGDGASNYDDLINDLSTIPHIHITAVCGKNKENKEKLTLKYQDQGNVEILGFVEDMQKLISTQDMGILRASPNTILEFISFAVPVILIGTILGQERGNITFVEKNKIGFYCQDSQEVCQKLKEILSEPLKIKELKRNELNLRQLNAASTLVDKIVSVVKDEQK
jgi:processive 1,2-diacylglycerol beta-glucosyltransferase